MKIKNVFFDFDGVLAESVNVKTDAFRQLYLPHGEDVAEKVVNHHLENGGVSRFEKFKIYHEKFLNKKIDKDLVNQLSNQFSALVTQGVIDSPEVEGARNFLDKYNGQLRYWIITGTPTDEMKRIAVHRDIIHFFEEICGSPTEKHLWTDYLIAKNGLLPDETIFLGDATTDYKAACHSKIHFALRTTEENKEFFRNYAGIRFSNFHELEQKINFQ